MLVLLITILLFEVILLTVLEKIVNKVYLTPFTILAVPYFIILLITVLSGPKMGFKVIYPPSVLVWIVGLFIFWIPGILTKLFFLEKYNLTDRGLKKISESTSYNNVKRWLLFLSWIGLVVSIGGWIMTVKKFGLENMGSESFTQAYSGGFSGHSIVFNTIPFILFVAVIKKTDKLLILTIFLIFSTFFLMQVKTWVMLPLISGLLLRYYNNNLRLNLKNILYLIGVFIIIFFTIYFPAIGPNIDFLKNHFFAYLFAGTLGLSEQLRNDITNAIDPLFLINPVQNIYNFIFGKEMKNVLQQTYVNIYDFGINVTNVRTFFGTIFLNSTLVFAIVYIISVSFFINFLFNVFSYSKNIFVAVITTFFLGGLAMGWFDFWFNHLNYYEIPFYILLLMIITKIKFPHIVLRK